MAEKEKMLFLFAFVAITVLTAVIVLLANIGFFGSEVRQSDFAKWGIGAVLGEIVIATITAFKWEVVSPINMPIILDIKKTSSLYGVNLEHAECSYEINDTNGERVAGGEKIKITKDRQSGYWKFFVPLPSNMKNEYVTTITLKDDKGKPYEMNDYILLHTLELEV